MLKIKDNVDLKKLANFGFIERQDTKTKNVCYVKKVYLSNDNDDRVCYKIVENDRRIQITRLDGEIDSTLYDLIKADIIEKVGN